MKIFREKPILGLMVIAVLIAIISNHNERIHTRKDLAMHVFIEDQINPDKYMEAIDFSKPVTMYRIKKGDLVIQYQVPGAPQGNFYGLEGATPTELGISDVGWDSKSEKIVPKVKQVYIATKDFDVLASYSAPVVDDWSTPEIETKTTGHKLQLFTTCKPCFKEAN